MKIKFNKASRTDGTLVTLNLAQFDGTEFEIAREGLSREDSICVTIAGQPVWFFVNREVNGVATTAVSHCYPRFLRLPQVSHPVYAEVTEVDY